MRHFVIMLGLAAMLASGAMSPAAAQLRTIDPNRAIDSDLAPAQQPPQRTDAPLPPDPRGKPVPAEPLDAPPQQQQPPADLAQDSATGTTQAASTYKRRDLFSAAENVFGKGAQGLGELLEKILRDQGEPNAYIAGREASGAALVGLRYGSGIMSHRVEGDMPVYWTGPSVGFDIGGNASKVFVLVYNLYDSADIYRRFPEGEGHLYFVGGFSATYLRRGNIVLIPVRLGVGARAGVNVGYMKFSRKSRWLPF